VTRLRIGYVVPSLDDTIGWGRWVNDFLKHIVQQNVEPVLWAPPSAARYSAEIGGTMPAQFVLPELFDSLRSLAGLRALRTLPRFWPSRRSGGRIDAVHSLEAYPWCLAGHAIARAHGVPHVITSHGRYGYIPYRRAFDRVPYSRTLREVAQLITVSDAVRREILKHFADALSPARVAVLLNAINADQVGAAVFEPPKDVGPVILSVTRFIRSKGLLMAVEAFGLVREAIPEAQYVIVGPGNSSKNLYFKEVEALIQRKGIRGISIRGRLSKGELAREYRQARLLLHTPITLPDDFEAYGLILLEAGAFGLPVVATLSGGHSEVVVDGVSGLLVPEADVNAAAQAMIALLQSPERARGMGEHGRQVALGRDWNSYCSAQRAIYDDVLRTAH